MAHAGELAPPEPRILGTLVSGSVVLALGLAALAGHLWHVRVLVAIPTGDGPPLLAASALSCTLGGMALVLTGAAPQRWRLATLAALGAGLIAFLHLAETVFEVNLAVDLAPWQAWLGERSPHPGRIGPISAWGDLAFAVSIILLPWAR